MRAVGDRDALPGITTLEQSPIIIEKLLLDQGQDVLGWKPALDRWSISEVLVHLGEVEQVFRSRVRAVIEQDNPTVPDYDQTAAAASGKYAGGLGREHLKKFCHERDLTLSQLRYVPPAAIARAANHGELGRFNLGELLCEMAFHDMGHIRQITELVRARVYYPRIGPWKKLYTVKP